ncbi:hypothetical protein OSB04_un000727 [Centaurea solstitialis]|uniref:Uncharacterized protein n=1 Tax=Centaurea solstitialis TaxID=347529 RepID=A0AA38SHF6_9ASTR|nr:hypothetical protein OSB04_un000727 [Centaurea solstitialis]
MKGVKNNIVLRNCLTIRFRDQNERDFKTFLKLQQGSKRTLSLIYEESTDADGTSPSKAANETALVAVNGSGSDDSKSMTIAKEKPCGNLSEFGLDGDDVRDGAEEDREAVRDDLVNKDAEAKGDGVKTDDRSGGPELEAKKEQKM